jgi:hypothetical protein
MHFYTFRSPELRKGFRRWAAKLFETTLKCLTILAFAMLPSTVVVELWYHVFFLNNIHVAKSVAEILYTTDIPILGIVYALLVAKLIDIVFDEYKKMRMAAKRRDIAEFMQLMDEDLSPLLHGMATAVAFSILSGLFVLEYPDFWHGALIIGVPTYVFTLLCIVVIEIDDPCHGFWVIKGIPKEWLTIDAKEWRAKHYVAVIAKEEVTITEVTPQAPSPTQKAA